MELLAAPVAAAAGSAGAAAGAGVASSALPAAFAGVTGTVGQAASAAAPSILSQIGSVGATLAQGVATAASVMSLMNAGKSAAINNNNMADAALAEARASRATAEEDKADIKDELLQALGRRDVAYAASGIDLGYGVARDRNERDAALADAAVERIDRRQQTLENAYTTRATQYQVLARRGRTASMYQAIGQGLGFVTDTLKRGPTLKAS